MDREGSPEGRISVCNGAPAAAYMDEFQEVGGIRCGSGSSRTENVYKDSPQDLRRDNVRQCGGIMEPREVEDIAFVHVDDGETSLRFAGDEFTDV